MAGRTFSKPPSIPTADKITATNAGDGPLTLVFDVLIKPTTIPPIIPAIKPEVIGVLDASGIPRQNGSETIKTVIPAKISHMTFLTPLILNISINYKIWPKWYTYFFEISSVF